MTRALLLVDLQNDFFPEGALPVQKAHDLFPICNDLQQKFSTIIASKDWHPRNHKSFASQHPGKSEYDIIDLHGLSQVLWPNHCVQNTWGSEFHPKLKSDRISKIVYKGVDPEIDSYSAFYDNAHRKSTGLGEYLKSEGITVIYILGLATDYCVLYSVLDARRLGLTTYVIEDLCFGIEKKEGDVAKAKEEMQKVGAYLIHSRDIVSESVSE